MAVSPTRTTAFMVAQSSSAENINKAKEESVWASTESATSNFESAFILKDDVYILFTVYNEKREEQTVCGLARMHSLATRDLPWDYWPVHTSTVANGFELEWIVEEASAQFSVLFPLDDKRMCKDGDTLDESASVSVLEELAVGVAVDHPSQHASNFKKMFAPPSVNTVTNYFHGVKKPARGRIVYPVRGKHIIGMNQTE